MSNSDDSQMRKQRLVPEEDQTGLSFNHVGDPTGVEISSVVDVAQLGGFAGRPIELDEIADKLKPDDGDFVLNADLGKLNQDMRKVREQQKNAQIQGWIDKAQKLMEQRDYPGAIALLGKVIAADPTSGQALFLIGYCHFALQDFHAALEALRNAHLHVKTQDLRIMVLMLEMLCAAAVRGAFERELKVYLDGEQYAAALQFVQDERQRSPSDPAPMYYECGVLFKMGRIDEARRAATNALNHVSAAHAPLFRELLATIDQSEFDKVYEEMRKAMRLRNWDVVDRLLRTHENRLVRQRQYNLIRSYITEKRSGSKGGGGTLRVGRQEQKSVAAA